MTTDGPSSTDDHLARVILNLLDRRAPGATICPSEAARAAAGADAADEEWRALMDPVRRVARDLVARGAVEVVQHGEAVDPAAARGPIRIRLVSR